MKNILFINPYIYDLAAFDFWIKPMGILFLSTILKKSGFNVNLIDCIDRHSYFTINKYRTKYNQSGKFKKIEVEKPEVLKFIENRKFFRYGISLENFYLQLRNIYPKPDVICITCVITHWYYGVNKTIEFIKQIYPDTPIIVGGNYVTLWEKHCKSVIKADYVITGPGEIQLPKLLSEIFEIPLKLPSQDLTEIIKTNSPDYSLYQNIFSGAVLTSRGCIFDCAYCASKKLFDKFIQIPVESAVEQIEYLAAERKVNDIAFYDDALLANAENHIIPILENIIKKNIKCRFHLPNAVHIKFITKKIAELMNQNNFDTIRLGIESSDENWHNQTGGKFKYSDFVNCIKYFDEAGIDRNKIAAYILVGLPGQTKAQVKDTVDFVTNSGIKVDYAFYSPLPFTKYWNESVKEFPQIENEPLLTNSTVFPVLTGLFFDRRNDYRKKYYYKL